MPLSLRISPEKDEMIRKAATKKRKSRSSYILEAVEEKLGLIRDREKIVRELAGWMLHEEAEELRKSIEIFDQV